MIKSLILLPFLSVVLLAQAPVITSANNAIFLTNQQNTFTVVATGNPTPQFTISGVPKNVTFVDNGDGTATLSGSPFLTVDFPSTWSAIIKASNGIQPDNQQTFSLIIQPGIIQHIIVIIQENRTPDNLLSQCNIPGADIIASPKGSAIPLAKTPDLGHAHSSFVREAQGIWPNGPYAYQYVQYSDIQAYCQIATTYGYADRMFHTNQGPSLPAHQFLISGTSQVTDTSNWFVSDNGGNWQGKIPCTGSTGAYVPTIDPLGDTSTAYPCFNRSSILDLFAADGVTWNYYGVNWVLSNADIWIAPWMLQNWYAASYDKAAYRVNTVRANTYLMQDIAEGHLPSVAFVTPTAACSDHPSQNTGCGPSWVGGIVNAIGGNPNYWANTIIIVTWDEWGGYYDHVPIMQNTWGSLGASYIGGFRVPMFVISAYGQQGFVSEQQHDFGSILRFIECQMLACQLIGPGTFADAIDMNDTLSEFFPGLQQQTKNIQKFIPITKGLRAITYEEQHSNKPVDTE